MKGDSSTKIYTDQGRKNYDRIFGKKKDADKKAEEILRREA